MKSLNLFLGIQKIIPTLILLAFLNASCIKETIDLSHISKTVDWNPKLGIPVAYGSLSLKDIINKLDSTGVMKQYSDGLLYITYHDRVFSKTVDSIITIPNQKIQILMNGSNLPGLSFPPNDTIKYQQQDSAFNFNFNNGAEIDSVNFKGGTLMFHVTSQFHHTGQIKITLNSLTQNGVPLQITMPINTTSGNFSDSIPQNLSGYKLKFNSVNKIPFTFQVILKNSGQAILGAQTISADIDIRHASFKSIFGYFGSYPIIDNFLSQTKIDVFENVIATNAKLADPRVNVCYSNSFGVPVKIQLSNTKTLSSLHGTTNVTLDPSINPFVINCPGIAQIGSTLLDTVHINKNNSSIAIAFGSSPEQFLTNVAATTNPAGKPFKNFALDTSKLSIDMEVEMPMDLQASNYKRIDTIAFDLSKIITDYSIVNKLAIFANFTNGIPCDLGLQVYFTDSAYNIVDSLFNPADQPIIKSGEIDTNGKVIKPGTKLSQFVYDNSRVKHLQKVKYALLYANITTAGSGLTSVKFYSNYLLSLALGVQIDFKITSLNQLQ